MNCKSIKLFLLAAALLSAFACKKTETTQINVNTAAVEPTPENANAADANTAEAGGIQQAGADAVVRDLYKTHDKDNGAILSGKDRKILDKYFTKEPADLMWKDLTAKSDEVGVLDFDPFYNAQDVQIKNFNVAAPRTEGDKSSVVVTFQNFDRKETLTYQLARQSAAWKVADIKYSDGSTLAGYFKEDAKNNASNNGDQMFEGTYKVGDTTCTVKPVKMAFEVKWAKGSGTMLFYFDGDTAAGKYSYSSEEKDDGRDTFIFDDDTFTNGTFVRADGREMPFSKVK